MSTDLDATRIVRSWLRTDEHESADRVLDTVLARLDATPQHRAAWPVRRFADMNSYLKLAIAVAAVIVFAVVGYNLLPTQPSRGAGGTPPSPSSSPSIPPSASASSKPTGADVWLSDISEPGTYRAEMNGKPMTFTLPSDAWRNSAIPGAIERGFFPSEHAFLTFIGGPNAVSTDPCAGRSASVPKTLTGAADAYTKIPGTHAVGPTDVTVGGRPGKLVVLTIDAGIPCEPRQFWLFGKDSMYPDTLESVIRTWIIDVDGELYEIDSNQTGPSLSMDQEIQQIVDSVQFG